LPKLGSAQQISPSLMRARNIDTEGLVRSLHCRIELPMLRDGMPVARQSQPIFNWMIEMQPQVQFALNLRTNASRIPLLSDKKSVSRTPSFRMQIRNWNTTSVHLRNKSVIRLAIQGVCIDGGDPALICTGHQNRTSELPRLRIAFTEHNNLHRQCH
jgi:hypothetical protein